MRNFICLLLLSLSFVVSCATTGGPQLIKATVEQEAVTSLSFEKSIDGEAPIKIEEVKVDKKDIDKVEESILEEKYPVYSAKLLNSLTLVLSLTETPTLSVPEQMIYFMPLERDGNVYVENDFGIEIALQDNLSATFSQKGVVQNAAITFELVSDDSSAYFKRPQDPQERDYLKKEIELCVLDGSMLSGELTALDEDKSRVAVILVSGSGAQDRNEEVANHRPFLVLSDYLTREGFAVLRFDDRGIGKSAEADTNVTTFDLVDDVYSEVRLLKTLGYKDIVIIGHSEGAVVANLVAGLTPLKGVVLMASPFVSGSEISLDQVRTQLIASGYNEFLADQLVDIYRSFYSLIAKGDYKRAEETFASAFGKDAAKAMIESISVPWSMTFLTLNPADYISHVKCPILILQGSKDTQVRPDLNEKPMLEAIENMAVRVEYCLLDGKNHLFQSANTGLVSEYGLIDETISPEVLDRINQFLQSL